MYYDDIDWQECDNPSRGKEEAVFELDDVAGYGPRIVHAYYLEYWGGYRYSIYIDDPFISPDRWISLAHDHHSIDFEEMEESILWYVNSVDSQRGNPDLKAEYKRNFLDKVEEFLLDEGMEIEELYPIGDFKARARVLAGGYEPALYDITWDDNYEFQLYLT